MKFIRFAALFGSLVLLVATAVSVLNRRGDMRNEQEARVTQTATLAAASVHNTVERATEHVHLTASALAEIGAGDDPELAAELAELFPGADACVGSTSVGCTGTDLLGQDVVSDLAAESSRSGAAVAAVSVDDGLLVVRRVAAENESTTVAIRLTSPVLLNDEILVEFDMMETNATVVFSDRPAADELGSIQEIDGDRVVTEIIGLPFTDGSVRVASSTDGSIGVFGDQPARYGLLLALGTVLLALAGWTFRVERRQLERRATTDELTGLINRREFERVSEAELDVADRFNSGLCVMVVDLNGFKQVNDTLGHQFGDLVLAASSERLVAAVRDTDVVGRWGGDEFVILLPGLADRGAVRKSAERIWQSLAGSPVVGDTVMTASIGAAMFPRHGITLDSLMRAADVAMYEAKSTGVSHRIADTIVVSDSDGDDDAAPSEGAATISTDQYAGPDRRHSPVPPPPSPSEELKEPTGLPRPGSDGRVDQPSKIS